jgi:hypothetical protein
MHWPQLASPRLLSQICPAAVHPPPQLVSQTHDPVLGLHFCPGPQAPQQVVSVPHRPEAVLQTLQAMGPQAPAPPLAQGSH